MELTNNTLYNEIYRMLNRKYQGSIDDLILVTGGATMHDFTHTVYLWIVDVEVNDKPVVTFRNRYMDGEEVNSMYLSKQDTVHFRRALSNVLRNFNKNLRDKAYFRRNATMQMETFHIGTSLDTREIVNLIGDLERSLESAQDADLIRIRLGLMTKDEYCSKYQVCERTQYTRWKNLQARLFMAFGGK